MKYSYVKSHIKKCHRLDRCGCSVFACECMLFVTLIFFLIVFRMNCWDGERCEGEVITIWQMKMKPKPGKNNSGSFFYSQHTTCVCVFCVFIFDFCWVKQRPYRILINLMPVFFSCLYRVYTFFCMYNKFILPWHGMRSYASNGSFCIQFYSLLASLFTATFKFQQPLSLVLFHQIYTFFYIFFVNINFLLLTH